MEIEQYKKIKVDAKILKMHIKISDRFSGSLFDAQGELIGSIDDEYVPSFFPGEHFGDYLIFDINIDTGQIMNWPTDINPRDVQEQFCPREDDD